MFLRPTAFLTAPLLIALLLLTGCGAGIQPLNDVVFGPEPLKQMQAQISTFRQLPDGDLKLLLAYLGANEKARLESKQSSQIDGKALMQVVNEARTWSIGMAEFISKSKEISDQLGRLVVVVPITKDLQDNDAATSKSQILRISYQLSNKTALAVTGVAGVIKYVWADGKIAATIPLSFEGQIAPGENVTLTGHQPILVGPGAAREMVAFAKAPLSAFHFEITTQAIRYEGGAIDSVPTL